MDTSDDSKAKQTKPSTAAAAATSQSANNGSAAMKGTEDVVMRDASSNVGKPPTSTAGTAAAANSNAPGSAAAGASVSASGNGKDSKDKDKDKDVKMSDVGAKDEGFKVIELVKGGLLQRMLLCAHRVFVCLVLFWLASPRLCSALRGSSMHSIRAALCNLFPLLSASHLQSSSACATSTLVDQHPSRRVASRDER